MNDTQIQFLTREEYEQMHKELQEIGAATPTKFPRKKFNRAEVADAFETAFELCGGHVRLAVWANSNYTEFIKLYGRTLPTGTQVDVNVDGKLQIQHVLPPTKLDKLENPNAGHQLESKVSD
jgi:hypothetical protein